MYLQTKGPNFGITWKALNGYFWHISWHFGIFMAVFLILKAFGTFCGHLVYFPPFWYVVPR
jgi:hypothetical protein